MAKVDELLRTIYDAIDLVSEARIQGPRKASEHLREAAILLCEARDKVSLAKDARERITSHQLDAERMEEW